jgi:hypothetical protein
MYFTIDARQKRKIKIGIPFLFVTRFGGLKIYNIIRKIITIGIAILNRIISDIE